MRKEGRPNTLNTKVTSQWINDIRLDQNLQNELKKNMEEFSTV